MGRVLVQLPLPLSTREVSRCRARAWAGSSARRPRVWGGGRGVTHTTLGPHQCLVLQQCFSIHKGNTGTSTGQAQGGVGGRLPGSLFQTHATICHHLPPTATTVSLPPLYVSSACRASGPGLSRAVAGLQARFTIEVSVCSGTETGPL